jgi:hypothetical protein
MSLWQFATLAIFQECLVTAIRSHNLALLFIKSERRRISRCTSTNTGTAGTAPRSPLGALDNKYSQVQTRTCESRCCISN